MAKNSPDDMNAANQQMQQFQAMFRSMQAAVAQVNDMQEDLANSLTSLNKTGQAMKLSMRRNRKIFDDAEDMSEDFNESYKDYTDLAKALKGFVGLKLEPKSITNLMGILKEADISVSELQKILNANQRYLRGDLLQLHKDIGHLKDAEVELIQNAANALDDTHRMVLKHGEDFETYQANLARGHAELSAALNKVAAKSPLHKMKLDPQAAASNLKNILNKSFDKIANMKGEFGFDSSTITNAAMELQESYNKVADWESKISNIMANSADANSKEGRKELNRYSASIAKEVVAAHTKISKLEEMGKRNRELVNAASGGYAAMLDLAEDTHIEFQRGVTAFRSGNLVEALSAFASSKKKAAFTGAAGSVAAKATGGSGGAMLGMVGMLGKFTVAINAIGMIVQLLMAARDQAADMNKELVGIYGLSDLGIDMKTDGFNDISGKLFKIRDELYGDFGEMFKFGVDASEVNEALNALQQAGITRQRLVNEGTSFREATEGVFAYAKTFGKSYGEMGSLMGKFAYELSMGTGETEKKFADIQKNWMGTRLSIDDFVSSVEEAAFENAIYGNRTSEVTRLFGLTGKNALLSGKQLMEAQKEFTNVIDGMDPAFFRSQIDMLGSGNYNAILKNSVENLKQQLTEVGDQGSQEAKDLMRRIRTTETIMGKISSNSASIGDYKRAALMASEQDQGNIFMTFMKNYLLKTQQATVEAFDTKSITEIMDQGQNRRLIRDVFFDGNEERLDRMMLMLDGAKDASGKISKSFNGTMEALANNQLSTEDLGKRNKEIIKTVATAGSQMMNSDKARRIAGEHILNKINYATQRIEGYLAQILGFDKKEKNLASAQSSFSQAAEEEVGSEKYQEKTKDALKSFFDFATDDRSSEEDVKKAWGKLTPEQQKIATEVKEGNFKSLDKINMSNDDKANLSTKGIETFKKLPKDVRDKASAATGAGGDGKAAKTSPITPRLAAVGAAVDGRTATNLTAGGKLTPEEIAFSQKYSKAQGMGKQAVTSPHLGKGMGFTFDAAKNSGQLMNEIPTAAGFEVKSAFKGKVVKASGSELSILSSGKGKSYIFKLSGVSPIDGILNKDVLEGDLIARAKSNYALSVLDSKGKELGIGPGKALADLGYLTVGSDAKIAASEQAKLTQSILPKPVAAPPNPNKPAEGVEAGVGKAGLAIGEDSSVFMPGDAITGSGVGSNTYESKKSVNVNLNGVPINMITKAAAKEAHRIVRGYFSTERVTQ